MPRQVRVAPAASGVDTALLVPAVQLERRRVARVAGRSLRNEAELEARARGAGQRITAEGRTQVLPFRRGERGGADRQDVDVAAGGVVVAQGGGAVQIDADQRRSEGIAEDAGDRVGVAAGGRIYEARQVSARICGRASTVRRCSTRRRVSARNLAQSAASSPETNSPLGAA